MYRIIFIFLSVFIITCEISAQAAKSTSTIDSIIVAHNNLSGGGFQSDVTITDDGLTVYSSADVSGIFKSTNGGLLYENINEGLKSPKVASLALTPDNDQILYAGTGDKGGSGGLFRSIDGGDTWELTGAGNSAQFAGNHSATADPIPDDHPRSNGDLIIVNEGPNPAAFTDDIVIAGTYKDGVKIFSQGGELEESAVNTSGFVRSLGYNSAKPDTVYAAIYFDNSAQNGIYEIDYTNPSTPISTLVFQTQNPEGITVLSSGSVYAAIGSGGIAKYNGTSWKLENTGLSTNNDLRQWTAVTGYFNGTNDIVYAGLNNLGGTTNGANYSNIWRTENGGSSWTPLLDANINVLDTIYGQSYEWWFRTDAFPQAGLGRTNSVVSSIDIARGALPNDVSDDIIYVSGRGGIWKSENGGDSWKPAVYNMQATANSDVAVNPNNSSQVAIANTDYVVIETGDRFTNNDISRDKPNGAESKGYDVIFDASSNELIAGVGDRDTNSPGGGEVYVKAATSVGNPSDSGWKDTNLKASTTSSNGRVRAVCYGYHDGNSATSQTILAVVEGEGVFRYHNGIWSKSFGINIGSTKRSNFVWPDKGNSGVVYLLDLFAGLYRSNDGGQNWSNIWPGMSFNNKDFFNTGYITADDNDPTTLYLSIQGRSGSPIGTGFKVYRMTGADTEIFGAPGSANISDITFHSGTASIKRPGPIVFGPKGKLWLTQQQNSSNSIYAALFVMENPKTDLSFTNLTNNDYRNIATAPSGIDVSDDGYVYISQSGTGLVKIKVVEIENLNTIPIANAGTDQTVEGNELVTLDGSASSDADGDTLTYLWTAPDGVVLSNAVAVNPTFIAPELDTRSEFTFSLVVNDGEANSEADDVVITIIENLNTIPIANAGTDQIVEGNELVTLDGSASSDADGDTLTYLWAAPEGVVLSNVVAVNPTFIAPELDTTSEFTFSLVVNDGKANSIADEVVITIKDTVSTVILEENTFKKKGLTIYPVPAKGNFIYLKTQHKTIGPVEIFDITGTAIIRKEITSTNGNVDVSKLASGIYILKTQDYYSRFIIK